MNLLVVLAIFCLAFAWLHKRWQERHTIRLALKVPSSKLQVLLGFGKIFNPKLIRVIHTNGNNLQSPHIMIVINLSVNANVIEIGQELPEYMITDRLIQKVILSRRVYLTHLVVLQALAQSHYGGIITECVKIAENYGKNALVYIGPYPYLLTSDPVVLRDILTSKLCLNKATIPYHGMAIAFGNGLITVGAKEWKHDRRMLNNSFSTRNLMSFLPIFNRRVSCLFVDLDRDIENGKNIPLMLFFREFTLNISLATIIGRDMDNTDHNIHEYSKRVARALKYISNCGFNWLYHIGFIRKLAELTIFRNSVEMIRLLETVIAETLRDFTTLRGVDPSYITDIKAAIDYVDQENMKPGEVGSAGLLHLFGGAFDTTATSLNLVLILLAIYTEHQERVYAELCDILPDDDAGEVEVVYEHIVQMQYLDRVINEAMRVLPIVPQTGRKVMGGSVTLSNGLVLPEGQEILFDFYSLHRSKDIWGPDAHKFNPDHFLPSNVEARHPYSFIPFSKGLRYCIGLRYAVLSLKVALARLIKRYKFTTTATMEDLVLENHITSQLLKQPPLTTERRKRKTDNI